MVMKNLLYKEWKLNVHAMNILFAVGFGFMMVIPSYPHFLAFVYLAFSYAFLFMGGNKGVDNNDIYYTSILPIRRGDVVKARTMTIMSLQLLNILATIPFAILYPFVMNAVASSGATGLEDVGLEPNIALYAMALLSYTLLDLIFIPWFYKTTSRIVLPYMVSGFVCMIFFMTVSMFLPLALPGYYALFGGWNNLPAQFILLAVSVIIYFVGHYFIVKISQKNFLKVDI